MKNFRIISSLVLCTTISSAQVTEDWVRIEPTTEYLGTMIARDASDNVFTLSSNFNILTGGKDIFVTKRDESGTQLWSVNYDNTIPQQWDSPTWITIDPSGNAIVTGYTNSSYSNPLPVQLIVMKFRGSDGALLWRRTYNTGSACRAWRALTDAAGNIYIGGDTSAVTIDHIAYGNMMVKKYSPNGVQIWSLNKNRSGNVMVGPLASMKFSKDGNIVICGLKLKAPYLVTNAKITTDGTILWSNTADGYGAADITSTADGKTYQLRTSGDNVLIDKISTSGNVIWSKTYDFGTGDIGKKIESDQNDDLVITGLTTQLSGLPYADWMTFKINADGQKLWDQRYNEHANNDEFPNFMVLDNANNIYITGQGGPYPGGSDLSAVRMVTLKYQPGGLEEWVALDDPIDFVGRALCLASDNNLYVVAQASAATIHYTQGLLACSTPTNLSTLKIEATSAKLKWTAVDGAFQYELNYKKSSANKWKTKLLPGTTTTRKLNNLVCNTDYEWKIRTVCDTGGTLLSDFSPTQAFHTLSCKLSEEMAPDETAVMNLSPNPASGIINVELLLPSNFHSGFIELRNISGQVCRRQVLADSGMKSFQIDISNFPPGIYSMSIFTGKDLLSKKIIIE